MKKQIIEESLGLRDPLQDLENDLSANSGVYNNNLNLGNHALKEDEFNNQN